MKEAKSDWDSGFQKLEDSANYSALLELKPQREEKENFFDRQIDGLIKKLSTRINELKKLIQKCEQLSQELAVIEQDLTIIQEEEVKNLGDEVLENILEVSLWKVKI